MWYVYTQMHCLPINNYENNVFKKNIAVNVIRLYPCIKCGECYWSLHCYTNILSPLFLVFVHKCIVYQQIVEICCKVLTFYCCNKYCSHSINELQEHASSHCSLLWYTKGIVYQQNYYTIGAESLSSTCLQSFVHVYSGY